LREAQNEKLITCIGQTNANNKSYILLNTYTLLSLRWT